MEEIKKEEIQKDPNPPFPKPDAEKSNNENIYDQYQKENIQTNEIKKEKKENYPQYNKSNESNEDKKEKWDKTNEIVNSPKNNDNNNAEKSKRHRRGKNEINDRNYRCPDCDKCYLSGPALTTHRKTKHGYGNNGEKRKIGRPKKDGKRDNVPLSPLNKFNNFFNDENRKPSSLDQSLNEKIITTGIITEYLEKIFNQCKSELFQNLENVEKYSFYELMTQNWNKENVFPDKECYSATVKPDDQLIKVKSYNLDELFFLYLKEFAGKTNKDYFWFMIKFAVLFRECINTLRKKFVKNEKNEEKNKFYTQVYNAETVPEICNDFFVEFMEPHDFFGMLKDELIELIQHFCYWLYSKQYTQSHLTLLE